ncbi:MAG: 2-amino-4-hydroxy-6-hydroxymethyldihydropteridine diphosphokinase [Thermodesulfobacteriota bacterium]|nr:2-amino-4-hydroxy-6-hydroxymethyldihydropteridine diphosphokinase [Thermodesulfobacteriota bacterium]
MDYSRRLHKTFIGIGSNVGDKIAQCLHAISLLESEDNRVVKKSSLFETLPWGIENQELFINCVVELETKMSAIELLQFLQSIERRMGRTKYIKWGPRIIDLDILFFNDEIINTEELEIPHPLISQRDFVLIPLKEIHPHMVHPQLGLTISELSELLPKREIYPVACSV